MAKTRLGLRLLKASARGNWAGVRLAAVPTLSRGCARASLRNVPSRKFYSTKASAAESLAKPNLPLWTTSRVLLLAGALASIGYAVGVNDAGNHVEELLPRRTKPPRYASKPELEKAIDELRELLGEDSIST